MIPTVRVQEPWRSYLVKEVARRRAWSALTESVVKYVEIRVTKAYATNGIGLARAVNVRFAPFDARSRALLRTLRTARRRYDAARTGMIVHGFWRENGLADRLEAALNDAIKDLEKYEREEWRESQRSRRYDGMASLARDRAAIVKSAVVAALSAAQLPLRGPVAGLAMDAFLGGLGCENQITEEILSKTPRERDRVIDGFVPALQQRFARAPRSRLS